MKVWVLYKWFRCAGTESLSEITLHGSEEGADRAREEFLNSYGNARDYRLHIDEQEVHEVPPVVTSQAVLDAIVGMSGEQRGILADFVIETPFTLFPSKSKCVAGIAFGHERPFV